MYSIEKNWKATLVILGILAFVCFFIPAFWPIGFIATVCLLGAGTLMLGIAVGVGAFKVYQHSRRPMRKKDDPHESLEKWKDVKKDIEILEQKVADDRSQFEELEAKEKSKGIKQAHHVKREGSANANMTPMSPLLSPPTSGNTYLQPILNTLSNPFQTLFGSNHGSSSSSVALEIEETEREAKERLVVVSEGLAQLDKDKEAKIAKLTAEIEVLKEKKEKISAYKKQ